MFALGSPHRGRLSDRLGRKRIILTGGLVGYTLGTVLFTAVLFLSLVMPVR